MPLAVFVVLCVYINVQVLYFNSLMYLLIVNEILQLFDVNGNVYGFVVNTI